MQVTLKTLGRRVFWVMVLACALFGWACSLCFSFQGAQGGLPFPRHPESVPRQDTRSPYGPHMTTPVAPMPPGR